MTAINTAVVLVNLGTPEAPTPQAVRRYLAEFLSDPRVVEIPRWIWLVILHGIILRTRPRRSAHAYASVWREDGSPLLAISQQQAAALRQKLAVERADLRIEIAMRYGQPALGQVLAQLQAEGIERLLILPMYPQYSATTTASVFDALGQQLRQQRNQPELRWIRSYAQEPAYIQALAASVRQHWAEHGRAPKLLMSFHGIPKRNVERGDPYEQECRMTAHALATALELQDSDWQLCFQSRFGKAEWLQPYTDVTLRELAGQGVHQVDIICPGFAADCLETLEEINQQFRELYCEAGGKDFRYIAALNSRAEHIDLLADIIKRHAWPDTTR